VVYAAPVTFRTAIVVFAALQIPAAFLSLGHHHPDEHFQILEFLNYKLGQTSADTLPWEFDARIRPFIQIAFYYPVVQLERAVGITDPFTYEISLRLVSALLGIAAFATGLRYLVGRGAFRTGEQPAGQRLVGGKALPAMAVCAVLPYLNARISAETVGASVFLVGVFLAAAAIDSGRRVHLLAAGLLLGLGFYIRFQLAFMLVGLAGWMVVDKREQLRAHVIPLVWLGAGFAGALAIGIRIDHWGYGAWVFTPWRYFNVNVLQNKAAEWGTAPWWDYVEVATFRVMPPLGLALLLIVCWTAVRAFRRARHDSAVESRRLLVWLVIPFVVGHSLIGHKETRFLFSLALPVTLMLGLFVSAVVRPGWRTSAHWTLMGFNVLWLAVLPYRPAMVEARLYEHVYDHQHREIYSLTRDPYVLGGLPVTFYRPPALRVHQVDEAALRTAMRNGPLLLFTDRLDPFTASGDLARACEPEYHAIPEWMESVNVNDWLSRVPVWSLYECGGDVRLPTSPQSAAPRSRRPA
jgi:GPI mannosyltransferase 3